jgi:hypothetical protein
MYGVNASVTAFGFDQVSNSVSLFLSRGLVAGLVSHALYSALVGAGIGAWVQSLGRPVGPRILGSAGPIAAGFLIHGTWDYAAFVGIKSVGVVTGISAIILVVIIYRWTNRQLRPWMEELLAPEVSSGLITDDELTAMVGSPRDRRHYVHAAKKEHRKAAGKATRHVLDAELDLAEALGQSDGTESEEVDDARSELQRLRRELNIATTP